MNNTTRIASSDSGIVLIDTWWNVNAVKKEADRKIQSVLIDTWWNVNVTIFVLLQQTRTVLIDTWWNVNVLCNLTCLTISNCFNRYMVECELESVDVPEDVTKF